jgi:hypothetical protein
LKVDQCFNKTYHLIFRVEEFLPLALQLRVSFDLLNNQSPFLSILHCSDDETSNGGMKK